MEKEIRYLFIDEITAVNGFIQSCALLADKYVRFGIHIVIAGTDSFVLELAKRDNNRKEYQLLLELNGRGLLKKAIEQAIAASNEMLTAYVITQTYQNGDLESAKQLLEHIFDIDSVLDTEEVEERVRYKLSIVKDFDADITESYVEELTEFLVEIGVIKMYYLGS